MELRGDLQKRLNISKSTLSRLISLELYFSHVHQFLKYRENLQKIIKFCEAKVFLERRKMSSLRDEDSCSNCAVMMFV